MQFDGWKAIETYLGRNWWLRLDDGNWRFVRRSEHIFDVRQRLAFRFGQNEGNVECAEQWKRTIKQTHMMTAQIGGHHWIQFHTNEANGVCRTDGDARTEASILPWEYFGIHDKWNGQQAERATKNVQQNQSHRNPAVIVDRIDAPCSQTIHACGHHDGWINGGFAASQSVQQQANYAAGHNPYDTNVNHAQKWIHRYTDRCGEFRCVNNNHEDPRQLLECKKSDHDADWSIDFGFHQLHQHIAFRCMPWFTLQNQYVDFFAKFWIHETSCWRKIVWIHFLAR